MDLRLKDHIASLLGTRIKKLVPCSGGDIAEAWLIYTESGRLFTKFHQHPQAHAMFRAEQKGLELLAKSNTIAVPGVLYCEPFQHGAFLIMEYIEPKRPDAADMELLGHQLAALHSKTADAFGLDHDNFIGSLPQSNKRNSSWAAFFVQERLEPQLKLAKQQGRLKVDEIPAIEKMMSAVDALCPELSPALLHGDLWGGNYLIASSGTPYLIDPAVYYGHSEIDLAMSRLFGGFTADFYNAYAEHLPNTPGHDRRQDLYQLYYLLVHLNLFGQSYYGSVVQLIQKIF